MSELQTEYSSQSNCKSKQLDYQLSNKFLKIQPDLYLILQKNIYPVHKNIVILSKYIQKLLDQDEKITILDLKIETRVFQLVLEYLYCQQLKFQRNQEMFDVLIVSKQMQIQNLFQHILDDFEEHFNKYNFFKLYSISIKLNIGWLRQRCEEDLMAFSYQQMNIYRLDLLEVDKSLFQLIVQKHQRLKANNTICGIGRKQMQQIVTLYNDNNKLSFSVDDLLQIKDSYYDLSIKEKEIVKRHKKKAVQTLCLNNQNKSKHNITSNYHSCRNIYYKSSDDKNSNNEKIQQKIVQLRDKIINIQCVPSPTFNAWQLQQKEASFQNFSYQQECNFLMNEELDRGQFIELKQQFYLKNNPFLNGNSGYMQEISNFTQ